MGHLTQQVEPAPIHYTSDMSADPLAEQRAARAALIDATLADLPRRFSHMHDVRRVYLFGSVAAGRRDLLTDLDLVVILDSDEDVVERAAALYRRLEIPVAADILAYTPEEFEEMRDGHFLSYALRNAEVIYETSRR